MNREEKRAYDRAYYRDHVDKDRKVRLQRERIHRIRDEVRSHKARHGCSRCGYGHPAALHFHHRDPSSKEFNVADAAMKGWGMDRIMKEVEKCDILCANCHAVEHDENRA